MHTNFSRFTAIGAAAATMLAATLAVAPRADAARLPCTFGVLMTALGDKAGTDVELTVVPRRAGCVAPSELKQVRIAAGTRTRAFARLPAPAGEAHFKFGPLRRHARLTVRALARKTAVRGTTRVRLLPDLSVRLTAPPSAVAGAKFTVGVDVSEKGRDTGASARLTLATDTSVLGTTELRVHAGGRVHLTLPVTLQTSATLVARVEESSPRDSNPANDEATASVQLAGFRLDPANVLVDALGGYGAQFNHHVYAAISQSIGVTPENVVQMENEVVALQPHLVRIFFTKTAFADADKMQSFVRTVQLAQRAGSTIDITWQSSFGNTPDQDMDQFAGVLVDLVRNRGISNLRWVTVQNEVNSTRITMDQYARNIRRLDTDLRAAGLRDQIRFMGGDLVGTVSPLGQSQKDWLEFMATQLADVVDAYGIHIFWDYWNTAKLARRLTEVRAIVDSLPESGRKPLYVTEYGIRARPSPTYPGGAWDDGSPFQATNVNAFQLAWFDVLAARLGYAGTIKWDAYLAKYDGGTQDYSLIGGPQEGWPQRPGYHLLHLFTQTTGPGWQVVAVDAPAGPQLVAGYRGPAGELTLIGLDTDGGQLNAVSPTQVTYRIGGVAPGTSFRLFNWNLAGDGLGSDGGTAAADAAGIVTVTVPLHAVFALTTRQL